MARAFTSPVLPSEVSASLYIIGPFPAPISLAQGARMANPWRRCNRGHQGKVETRSGQRCDAGDIRSKKWVQSFIIKVSSGKFLFNYPCFSNDAEVNCNFLCERDNVNAVYNYRQKMTLITILSIIYFFAFKTPNDPFVRRKCHYPVLETSTTIILHVRRYSLLQTLHSASSIAYASAIWKLTPQA